MRYALTACLAATVLCAARAEAQTVSPRVAIAAVGEWRPSVQAGFEMRDEIGDGSSSVDSLGVTHRKPPRLLWSAMALGGVSFGRNGHDTAEPRLTAQGQVGVLYRASGSMRLGLYGVGLAEPAALGALARVEPMSAVGLQAGWVHRTVRPADVAVVQLDVGVAFIVDLIKGGGR